MARYCPDDAYPPHHQDACGPRPGTGRHDAEIRDEVYSLLVRDSRVEANQVDVEVEGGVVTLQGQVDSLAAKRAATADAWEVSGVADVENLLHIPHEEPTATPDR